VPFLRQYRLDRERDGYRAMTAEAYRMLPSVVRDDPHAVEWRLRRESYRHLEQHALPFEGAQFDLVVFGASLHYARSPERALAEARRMLGAAGAIVIMDSPLVAVPRMCEAMGLSSHFFESRGPLRSRFRRFLSNLSQDARPRPYGVWVIA